MVHGGNKIANEDSSAFADDVNNNTDQQIVEIQHLELRTLVYSIKEKLETACPLHLWIKCCIYRVPRRFQERNKGLYTPHMVSIGPFHHGKSNLKATDNLKLQYVHALLSRTTKMGWQITFVKCYETIRLIEEEARKCYSEPINLNSDEFVEMMLYDGLFIIELFRKSAGEVKIERNDPLFANPRGLSTLARDLVLLENQLPMPVLNCLFNLPSLREELQSSCSITTLALRFFDQLMPRDKEVLEKYSNCEGKHLLDLLGKTFHAFPKSAKTKGNSWKFVPSVTELKSAGVKFKKGTKTDNFLDIKFRDGALEFPPLVIKDQTATLLGNLIAFEQCYGGHVSYMTSYALFMNSILSSTGDVKLLRNEGIITNYLGKDEDISSLFTKLCCEVTRSNFYYSELCDQVNAYREKATWHEWRAALMRCPSKKQWALLVLTMMSALFTVVTFAIRR